MKQTKSAVAASNVAPAKQTNDLRYTITTSDKDGNDLIIKISLNDKCKNGHQDFAITAMAYKKGLRGDRAELYGGCCHDEILKAKPELKIFVDLHLCDYLGQPMYAIANGFYHLTEGFNNVKPEDKGFKEMFCNYYRVTPLQFDELVKANNKMQYYTILEALNVRTQWKAQADEAIKLLEDMTGETFLIDSVRTQIDAPTPKQLAEEAQRQASGYYTEEAKAERELTVKNELIAGIKAEMNKECKKHKLEAEVKIEVLEKGGSKGTKHGVTVVNKFGK